MKRLHTSFVSAAGLLLAWTLASAEIVVGAPFALSGPVAEQAKAMRQGVRACVATSPELWPPPVAAPRPDAALEWLAIAKPAVPGTTN